VDLKKAVNSVIELSDTKLSFTGEGYGAAGQQQYFLYLEFFDSIDSTESFYKVIERDIQFVLKKKEPNLWPRLISSEVKPPWLKIDFDRFEFDDDDQDEEDWQRTPKMMRDILEGDHKRKSLIKTEDFRKIYLFLYNLFQTSGCIYLAAVLGLSLSKAGPDYSTSYAFFSSCLKVLHLLKLLEILHPILGYTTGDQVYPAIETGFRLFLLFVVVDSSDKVSGRRGSFNLLLLWSVSDFIKYLYYIMRTFEVETPLTWIYYTSWFILFPMEFLCQAVLLLVAIPILQEEKIYTVSLPNWFNVSFSLASILKGFLLFAAFPVLCMKCKRMYLKRKYRVGNAKKIKTQ